MQKMTDKSRSSLRVAIYARVSTVDKGQNPEVQLKPLREYCTARGLEVFSEYVDVGQSGKKDHRPQLDRLMNDSRKRLINCIIVWKLDRFGRSLKHLVTALDELNSLDVSFISYQENIDLSTPSGRLMFHMIAAMAEFERELIRERVCAGVAHARAKGKKLGRKGLAPVEIKLVISVYDQDTSRSVRTVARLAKTSPATAARILSDYRAGLLDSEGLRHNEPLVSIH